jgi:hypothetical protein
MGLTVLSVLCVFWTASLLLRFRPPDEICEALIQALRNGDAATVQAMSIESDGARVWDTLILGRVDKAETFFMRGMGWSVNWRSGRATGYLDFTAEKKDGMSVPFRLEVARGGIFFTGPWQIRRVVLDAKK